MSNEDVAQFVRARAEEIALEGTGKPPVPFLGSVIPASGLSAVEPAPTFPTFLERMTAALRAGGVTPEDSAVRTWTYRAPGADALTTAEREDVEAVRAQLRDWTPDPDEGGIGGGPVFDRYLEDVRILLDVVDRLAPPVDIATITIEHDAE